MISNGSSKRTKGSRLSPVTFLLDTGNPVSRASFEVSHRDFIRRICELRDEIRTNEKLAERIRYKYSIKNVTGLNLLPFVRFDDPFEIIAHLMAL